MGMMSCLQAIARIYRYGQKHATFVYRLLYKGTAEHRVYRRNVDKEGLFMKVVDKQTVKGDAQPFLVIPHCFTQVLLSPMQEYQRVLVPSSCHG